MGTKTFTDIISAQKTLPYFWKTWIESRQFPCSFLLAGPCQRRAFRADSAPFVDTGHLIVIWGNYYRESSCSQVKNPNLGKKLVKICHFHLTTAGFSEVSADDDKTARVNEGLRVRSKSPLLVRAGEEEGARKLTRLASSFPNAGTSFLAWKRLRGKVLVEYLPLHVRSELAASNLLCNKRVR